MIAIDGSNRTVVANNISFAGVKAADKPAAASYEQQTLNHVQQAKAAQIGEVIIPYDVDKIQRDTKWFSTDTVRVALGLYAKLGLIYQEKDGTLVLANHSEMVGSETDYAAQKKLQRTNQRQIYAVHCGQCPQYVHTDVHKNVHTDIRY